MSSRTWKLLSVVSVVGALAGLAGCSDSSDDAKPADPAATAAQPVAAAQPAQGEALPADQGKAQRPGGADAHRPHRGPGGPEFLLAAALHELELTDGQKAAIEAALDKAAPARREPTAAERAPFAALAQGVRAGKVDPAAVAASVPAEGPAHERVAAATEALQTLHKTLTREQRQQLVDALSKRAQEHQGKHGHHGLPPGFEPPHDGEAKAPPHDGKGGREGFRGGPMGPMGFLRDLGLTDAQKLAIHKAFEGQKPAADHEAMKARFEAMRAEHKARLDSFVSDAFDAGLLAAPPADAKGHGPRAMVEHMARGLAVVVPLLDDAQREKLAALIEKGPPAPHAGMRGHRGPPAR